MGFERGNERDWRDVLGVWTAWKCLRTDRDDIHNPLTLTLMSREVRGKGADVDECRRCDTTTFTRHQRQNGMGEGGKVD
jgi:hypothetical protein